MMTGEMKHEPEISSQKPTRLRWMGNLSLKHKLMAIIMLTCVSVLFLAGLILVSVGMGGWLAAVTVVSMASMET